MTLWQRVKAAGAAFRAKSAEEITLDNFLDALGVRNLSGPEKSEATYFACLKVLSESIGKLPFKIQQSTPGGGVRVAREHPYYRMLNERPNRYMTATTFWAAMELNRNHHGNAYAWIDTRNPRKPQLWLIDPKTVTVYVDNARRLADVEDIYYRWETPKGVKVLGSEEVLHFKSHNSVDGIMGISVREQLAATVQGGIKAQKFINKTIERGMVPKSTLQYTGSLSDANVKELIQQSKDYLNADLTDADPATIIPLPVGFSLTPLNIKLADSQFLELRQFNALQIASAFGVKPYQIGDYTKSSYASAEQQALSFLIDTLLFNVKQYEEETAYKLLSDAEESDGYHTKLNTGVLLRADQKTQMETLGAAVNNFLLTPNEAREMLDRPAKEGGDQLLGNGASIPVQFTGAQYTQITAREEDKKWLTKTIMEAVQTYMKGQFPA